MAEIPKSDEFYFAVLDWANRIGGKFSRTEAESAMVAYFDLAPAQQNRMTRGGNIECYRDRTRWATSHLRGAGMLYRDGAANYEITNFGRRELAASNGRLTTAYLRGLKGKMQASSPSREPKGRTNFQGGTEKCQNSPQRKGNRASNGTGPPRSDEFYFAVLDWANGAGGEFSRTEAERAMVAYFNSTTAKHNRAPLGGSIECYGERTRWAITLLHGAGLLDQDGAENYGITNFGRKELAASDGRFSTAYLHGLNGMMAEPEPRP